MKEIKAMVLFSGGLDSILAAKVLSEQNIKVTALSFSSYFFDSHKANQSATKLGIDILIKDVSECHLEIVKQPKYGHGNGLNPCIDCHALMLKKAYEIMQNSNFDILATGEVLGQRPFSQNKNAFHLLEKETGFKDKILRPLSAKLLPVTEYEANGLVDRKKLMGVSGRSRQAQLEMARKWNIVDYPTPAGGCCLTEKIFSQKLEKLLQLQNTLTPKDFRLIRFGRHFWLENDIDRSFWHVILGRNQQENLEVVKLYQEKDLLIKRGDDLGPTALIRMGVEADEKIKSKVKDLIYEYSKKHPLSEKTQWEITG